MTADAGRRKKQKIIWGGGGGGHNSFGKIPDAHRFLNFKIFQKPHRLSFHTLWDRKFGQIFP